MTPYKLLSFIIIIYYCYDIISMIFKYKIFKKKLLFY